MTQTEKSGKREVAAALSMLEQDPHSEAAIALLDAAFSAPYGDVIGITGPPGAGKSTLTNALISAWRAQALSVAVLAVDPSSRATGGALLGDRVRMRTDPLDQGVFVRSVAARGRLGGLADIAYPAVVCLRSIYDKVIVESVGVGQSETEIANVCDTVVLCVQPGSGDSLQFMKAGIAEIPDIAVVTKADMGAVASRALADLKGALSLVHRGEEVFEPICLSISALHGQSLDTFYDALATHRIWLDDQRLGSRRATQARHWLESEILTEFGRRGLAAVGSDIGPLGAGSPFRALEGLLKRLCVVERT